MKLETQFLLAFYKVRLSLCKWQHLTLRQHAIKFSLMKFHTLEIKEIKKAILKNGF